MDADAVRVRLKEACKAVGTASAWAAQNGCSVAYVSDVMNRRRDPGEAILGPLGLRRVVAYVPREPEATTGVQFGDPSPAAADETAREGDPITHGR